MARYSGKKGVVYLSTSGSGNATKVDGLTKWSINMSTDKVDVTAMGDGNKRSVMGLPAADGSLSFWWDDAVNAVFTAAASADGAKFYLYPSSDATTEYFYGACWVDYSMEGSVDGQVSYTVNLAANGTWTFQQAA